MAAIYQIGNKSQIWVVEDGKAKLKDILVKSFDGNDVLVNGLNVDDEVVIAGVHKLREGQNVRTE